jgi:hypothetical protein
MFMSHRKSTRVVEGMLMWLQAHLVDLLWDMQRGLTNYRNWRGRLGHTLIGGQYAKIGLSLRASDMHTQSQDWKRVNIMQGA